MKQPYHPKTLFKLSTVFLLMFTLLIIHSCKKDSTYQDNTEGITSREVLEAKSWYESAYPASVNSVNSNLTTLDAGKGFDYSQHTKPDWRHNISYKRFNANVVEIPVDPANPVLSQLKNSTSNKAYADKENSRSSFLILNDGAGYHAYIMTVIGAPAYLKGNPGKLKNNTYNHRDTDFTGMVFYFTPKGQYVSGYAYKNGHRLKPASANAPASAGMKTTAGKLQLMELSCVAWYMGHYVDGELVSYDYMYTICTGDDGSGGGGTPVPPAPLCPPGTTAINPGSNLQIMEDTGGGETGLDPDGGDGFPPPAQTPCTVPAIIDSVKNPCLKAMVDSIMSANIKGKIDSMIQNVFGGTKTLNLTFTDQKAMVNSTDDGEDIPFYIDPNNPATLVSVSINLNAGTLATSSREFIAATVMHEALHAYLDSKGIAIGDAQHDVMAANYVTTMASDLMMMFP